MAWRTPPSLVRFCREVLPLLCRETNGKALLTVVADIMDVWKVRREHLKNACPPCTIRPLYPNGP